MSKVESRKQAPDLSEPRRPVFKGSPTTAAKFAAILRSDCRRKNYSNSGFEGPKSKIKVSSRRSDRARGISQFIGSTVIDRDDSLNSSLN
jgi:hypothetical protein